MAIPKVFGLENEFAILHRGVSDPNPIAASSVLINAYINQVVRAPGDGAPLPAVGWDFEDEMPSRDARGMAPVGSMPPEVETHLVNAVLTNGARYYVDHAHPELSTPECANVTDIVRFDRSAEVIAARSMVAANALLPEGEEIVLYKNNSDRKGNSYGCHENYLMDRTTPFGSIVTHVMPHFITRQIFTGSGKVGTEIPGGPPVEVNYQITQRADFFEEEVGLETTLKRPIVNTRDEPHADAHKYRRLHVIVGDANMSEVATLLKVGTTGIVLSMIEDGYLPREFRFRDSVRMLQKVSYDLTLAEPLELVDGSTVTALEVQWELLDRARKYAESGGLGCMGDGADEIVNQWEEVLTGLEDDPSQLADRIDWIAKKRLIDGYRERHDLEWDDARLVALDLQYSDLRPERSLAARAGLVRLISDEDIELGIAEPPENTRAYFRGQCLAKWPESIVAANWDSLVFDLGDDPLRRVPMMEPTRGTRSHVGDLIEQSDTIHDLLAALGG